MTHMIALAAILAGLAAGLASPAAAQTPATLRIGLADDADALDPTLSRMYLYTPNNSFAMSTKVRGFVPVADGMVRLQGMLITP